MDLREADTSDAGRLREVARSAMTTSYALSPQQLDAIVAERFDEERLTDAFADEGFVVFVAEDSVGENGSDGGDSDENDSDGSDAEETERTVAGFVEGRLDGEQGEVRWLFVDPEHRGRGIGSRLFETITETLRERGADTVRATTFEANTEGSQFFERFGFERTDQREIEIGEQSLTENVYTGASADTGGSDADAQHADSDGHIENAALPGVAVNDGDVTATTEDGRELFLDREAGVSGTDGPLVPAYEDDSLAEQFGYYCGNCGSLDVTVDETERIECPECANTHEPRSDEAYDDSYL